MRGANLSSKQLPAHLRTVEHALASDAPFAGWHDIVNRTLTYGHRAIEILARREPTIMQCLRALETASVERRFRVLGDPVVRAALNEALTWAKDPSAKKPCDALTVISGAERFLRHDLHVAPLEYATLDPIRIGEEPYHAWVWSNERSDDLLGQRFQALFDQELAHGISSKPAILRTPDERHRKALRLGRELLDCLLPDLARSVCAHVHLVAVVDVADRRQWNRETRSDLCQNVSTHAIPGTIFLSPSPLRSSWHAAEAILHEAAHKKLSDLVLTQPVFRPGFNAAHARTIRAAWNSPLSWNSNDWSIDRALFAFHVYVHLALFFPAVALRAEELQRKFGPLRGMHPSRAARVALERAQYLGAELERNGGDDLGPLGRQLVPWLSGLLNHIDPSPPAPNLGLRLWLHRYDRETREISDLIERIDDDVPDDGNPDPAAPYEEWSIRRLVDHLIHSEVVAAYRILSILGEQEPPALPFYDGDRWSAMAASSASFAECAAVFRALRTFVSRTLRAAPFEAFARPCWTRHPKTLADIVIDMVEHAYRHVDTLVHRLRRVAGQIHSRSPLEPEPSLDGRYPAHRATVADTELCRRLVQMANIPSTVRTLLDVGCGLGIGFAKALPDCRITMIDLPGTARSQGGRLVSAIELARRAGCERRLLFGTADRRSLPFDPGAFDCVVSDLTVYPLTQTERLSCWREMYRVLRDGGTVVCLGHDVDGEIDELPQLLDHLGFVSTRLEHLELTRRGEREAPLTAVIVTKRCHAPDEVAT